MLINNPQEPFNNYICYKSFNKKLKKYVVIIIDPKDKYNKKIIYYLEFLITIFIHKFLTKNDYAYVFKTIPSVSRLCCIKCKKELIWPENKIHFSRNKERMTYCSKKCFTKHHKEM